MSRIKIGLFAPGGDKQTALLQRRLDELAPGAARHFTIPEAGAPHVALDNSRIEWDGANVAELECGYVHGFRYASPAIPRPLENPDWTLWQSDYITDQQRASFLHSAFLEMERRGVRLYNPPAAHVEAFALPNVFEMLRQSGFRVPQLVCTNDRDAAEAFCDQAAVTVWRPATGRAPWQRCTAYRRDRVMGLDKPPILIASVVEGPLIRAYLLNGQPLLLVKSKAPAFTPPLERLEVFMGVDYPQVHHDLERITELLDLGWAAVSFVVQDDRPWIYGVDPDPVWTELPAGYRDRLMTGLAKGLAGQGATPLGGFAAEPEPRETLFLRRMLQPLFELEHRKYHPDA